MSSFIPEEYVDFNDEDSLRQKYRSIAVVPDTPSEFNRSYLDRPYEPESFSSAPIKTPAIQFHPSPMHVGRYSFTVKVPMMSASAMSGPVEDVLHTVVRHVTELLGGCDTFHFSHIPGNIPGNKYPMWKGKHLVGSSCCEVDVHLYHGDDRDSYVVDVVRIKGDAPPFHHFFRTFKCLALNTTLSTERRVPSKHAPLLSQITGQEKDMLKVFEPVFALCQSLYSREARLEGVKMFYNVLCKIRATDERGLSEPDFMKSCIARVESLIFDECEDISQHAILLFGFLSQIECYRSALIQSNVVPFLFQFVEFVPEPFYDSIHVRRACASTIATLSQHDSKALVRNYGVEVKSWTTRVAKNELKFDSEVYKWAEEARSNLSVLV